MDYLRSSLDDFQRWDLGTWPALLGMGPDSVTALERDCRTLIESKPEDIERIQREAESAWRLLRGETASRDMEWCCADVTRIVPSREGRLHTTVREFHGADHERLYRNALDFFNAGRVAGYLRLSTAPSNLASLAAALQCFAGSPQTSDNYTTSLGLPPWADRPALVARVVELLPNGSRERFAVHMHDFLARRHPDSFPSPVHRVSAYFPTFDALNKTGSVYELQVILWRRGESVLIEEPASALLPVAPDLLDVIHRAFERYRSRFTGPLSWPLRKVFPRSPLELPTDTQNTHVRTVSGRSPTLAACVAFRALADGAMIDPHCIMSAQFDPNRLDEAWREPNPRLFSVNGELYKAEAGLRYGHLDSFQLAAESVFEPGRAQYINIDGKRLALVRSMNLVEAYQNVTGQSNVQETDRKPSKQAQELTEQSVSTIRAIFNTTPGLSREGVESCIDSHPELALPEVPELPEHFGPYRVLRKIGSGGMCVVYEAEDQHLGRRVAVKVLRPERGFGSETFERFKREAMALARVEHINIVPIFEANIDNYIPYIIMPLLKGESLRERLCRGPVAPREAIRIASDVAAGMAAAHQFGLVHRDIKPGNVWLAADTGRAILLDFGLALWYRDGEPSEESRLPAGTAPYMSPEQWLYECVDHRADLFSFGAMLYECVTGVCTFRRQDRYSCEKAVLKDHPTPPRTLNSAVPAALSDLIMRLLAKDPANRHDIITVITALDKITAADTRHLPWIHWITAFVAVIVAIVASLTMRPLSFLFDQPQPTPDPSAITSSAEHNDSPQQLRYQGNLNVRLERIVRGMPRVLQLGEQDFCLLAENDQFRIESELTPPGYVYVVWIDPDRDVTPVYPWDPTVGWGSRPVNENPVEKVNLPRNSGKRYTVPKGKPGVVALVMFARSTPLDVPDEVVREWFEGLPDLSLPLSRDAASVKLDQDKEGKNQRRAFAEVGSDDPFANWRGQLQKTLEGRAAFHTAVTFTRTGTK